MPRSIPHSRYERRERARWLELQILPAVPTRSCLYCLATLANGRAVCCDECDEGWWTVVPTLDGELYDPDARPDPPARGGPLSAAEKQRRHRAKVKAEREMQVAASNV